MRDTEAAPPSPLGTGGPRPRRASLLTGILVATLLLVVASAVVIAAIQGTALSRGILQQAIIRGEEMAAAVRISLQGAEDVAPAAPLVGAIGSREEVLDITVADSSGRRLLKAGLAPGTPLSKELVSWIFAPRDAYDPSRGPVRHRISPDGSTLAVASTAMLAGDRTAGIYLSLRLEGVNRAVAEARRALVLVLLVDTAILTVVFGAFLFLVLVRPIRRMVRTSERVRDGDLAARVGPVGKGEVNTLAAELDDMFSRLEEKIVSLQDANAALVQTREELIAAEKLATVGRIAAGLAHEVGNPLAAIIGYVRIMESQSSPERRREYLDRMGGELTRIHRIIGELVNLARPGEMIPGPVDVVEVIRRTAALMADHPDFADVAVRLRLPDALSHPALEAGRLQQVIVNLMLNAAQAMPDGGTLTITAAKEGGALGIAVEDTGTGILPEAIDKVFEPFFSTKDPGKGLGLGLSICRRIVTLMGGTIAARSIPGEGSAFTVRFPLPPRKENE